MYDTFFDYCFYIKNTKGVFILCFVVQETSCIYQCAIALDNNLGDFLNILK
ncbi:hypothetical protein RintRC_5878 [Richelia intracellularis]|nr:hypothetical protein RintRC_5878 [Richelia intracellularis]